MSGWVFLQFGCLEKNQNVPLVNCFQICCQLNAIDLETNFDPLGFKSKSEKIFFFTQLKEESIFFERNFKF